MSAPPDGEISTEAGSFMTGHREYPTLPDKPIPRGTAIE
jgi:hypothetical protein